MKLGILAYASDTGLGNQTRDYVQYLNPDRVMAVDISSFNKMPVHREWYPQAWRWVNGIPTDKDCEEFVDRLDCILVGETPLNYRLFSAAKEKGVKAVQAYNYEFLDFFRQPSLPGPAVLAAPSSWNTQNVVNLNIAPVQNWPVGVNRNKLPFREIKECKTFIHIIGRPAVNDRNGTIEFIKAALELGDKYKYVIFLQPPTDFRAVEYHKPVDEMIKIAQSKIDLKTIHNVDNPHEMYLYGDVLVMPRKYGGLCLPMQEALSAGLPVVMTDICPNDDRLPKEWLVKSTPEGQFYAHTNIDYHKADVNDLVKKIYQFTLDSTMREANLKANELAEEISWIKLAPQYLSQMNELCK